jgi:hypothetical protein
MGACGRTVPQVPAVLVHKPLDGKPPHLIQIAQKCLRDRNRRERAAPRSKNLTPAK